MYFDGMLSIKKINYQSGLLQNPYASSCQHDGGDASLSKTKRLVSQAEETKSK